MNVGEKIFIKDGSGNISATEVSHVNPDGSFSVWLGYSEIVDFPSEEDEGYYKRGEYGGFRVSNINEYMEQEKKIETYWKKYHKVLKEYGITNTRNPKGEEKRLLEMLISKYPTTDDVVNAYNPDIHGSIED